MSSAAKQSQQRYYAIGLTSRINQRLAALAPAQNPVPRPNPDIRQSTAPKLNPPKYFNGESSEYGNFIMQLSLIFGSDPTRYNTDLAKIAYAASFLSGSAKEWFRPQVHLRTGVIAYQTWEAFTNALAAAFDDPDAYQTAERKLKALKPGYNQDCSFYHA